MVLISQCADKSAFHREKLDIIFGMSKKRKTVFYFITANSGSHVIPGSTIALSAYENNPDQKEIARKLANKQRDYALPQSDSHRNIGTRWGKTFNEMARGIALTVGYVFLYTSNYIV